MRDRQLFGRERIIRNEKPALIRNKRQVDELRDRRNNGPAYKIRCIIFIILFFFF